MAFNFLKHFYGITICFEQKKNLYFEISNSSLNLELSMCLKSVLRGVIYQRLQTDAKELQLGMNLSSSVKMNNNSVIVTVWVFSLIFSFTVCTCPWDPSNTYTFMGMWDVALKRVNKGQVREISQLLPPRLGWNEFLLFTRRRIQSQANSNDVTWTQIEKSLIPGCMQCSADSWSCCLLSPQITFKILTQKTKGLFVCSDSD